MLEMMGWKRWLRAALFGLLLAVGAAAAAPRSLRFEHIGSEQGGLPQETVLNILQDRQGFMWFGTQAGLARFDGYKMTVSKNDPADHASLPDNYVLSSLEDEQGRLWFGTKGGLARYDRTSQKFVRYIPAEQQGRPSNRSVTAIVSDARGGLWLATFDGLKHFDPAAGRFTSWRNDPADRASLSDDKLNALALDGRGALWVGTSSGLDRLKAGAARFDHFSIGPAGANAPQESVLALSMGPRDTLWIGSASGLDAWRLSEAAPQSSHIGKAEGMSEGRVLTLYHDKGANLWVGTENDGLKWRDPSSGQFVSYRNLPLDRHSLSDNQVGAVLVDRTGTLWVGNAFGGVNRADLASGGFGRFVNIPGQPDSISSNRIRAIAGDGAGHLWLGSTGGGLNLLDPVSGKAERIVHDGRRPGSLPDDVVTAVVQVGTRLWVGSPTGLAWRDPASGRFTTVALGPDANASYIQSLRADRAGNLWVVSRGGLHQIGPDGKLLKTWRHDPRDPASLGENYGFAALEDRHGTLWVGTDNGLERMDRASAGFRHYRHDHKDPDSLRHNRIYYLFESSKGELWVGTAGGLHRLELGANGKLRFRFFPLTDAGAANPVGAILEDGSGALWISTTVGITRLDPATGEFKSYTSQDGLIDGSYFVGAGFRAPGGDLTFGGVNGLTVFTPDTIRDNPYPPAVLITDFLVFNQPLSGQGSIADAHTVALSYRDSVLSLEFAALHYADPERNRYAYRLEGFDEKWVETGAARRFATYTNLDPGNYVFQVKASNKDGVWSEVPATLAITITPPLWKTWWFRLLATMLVLGTAGAAYRWRIHALVQQKTRLAREVGTRTAELVLEKEAVEGQKREVERQKETVELAHRNISLLSEIGRKLTAKLDSEAIMQMLYEHVKQLMDASVFGIGVYRPERESIDYPFAIEGGSRYAPYSRSMREPNQLAVWCIANEREVFINDLELEYRNYIANLERTIGADQVGTLEDGSKPTAPRSLLYVPIVVNGRMVGVVTVHSFRENAYRRFHLDMLRTLAAYVGVAFDNADAYRQLQDTQAQLVAQDKLAALGSLVAGVAHELNTPIGNSLLMASTLQEKTDDMAERFGASSLRRSDLGAFIAASQEASALIMRSLHNAADLVNSFKQVAVDQASAQRRRFNLEQVANEVVATMMNQVRKAGHTLELTIDPAIEMDSFPGPFGQVVINFINNALLHAFEQPGGQMRLAASTLAGGRVQVEFSDNGGGIPAEHQARIFDPFFTTKMGQGGSGLGLHITYNIVTSLLEGTIRVDSSAQRGTSFVLDLPLVVGAAA